MSLSTIQILSSQYEISSQLSPQLGLQGLIKSFFRTVIRRYTLKNIHLYLKNNPSLQLGQDAQNYGEFSVVSNNAINITNAFHSDLISHFQRLQSGDSSQKIVPTGPHNYCLILNLPDLGFIVFETRGKPIDDMQARSLQSVLKILAEHISACTEKEALRQSHDKIFRQLYFHELTNLPNRSGLFKAIEEWEGQHNTQIMAVMFNVKDFSLINHQHGYSLGDVILKRIANELESEFGKGMVYHIGPDEFLTVCKKSNSSNTNYDDKKRSDKVKNIIREKTQSEDGISIDLWSSSNRYSGVDQTNIDKLNALEFAMSLLRAQRKELHLIIDDETRERFRVNHKIHSIIANELPFDEFSLVYQPQYDIYGDIIGAEILVRWQHPVLGNISPDLFIPLLEANQNIVELDQYILKEALKAADQLKNLTSVPPKLAINVSGHSLLSDLYYELVMQQLNRDSNIVLELTESAQVFNLGHMASKFEELTKAGIEIHLDDFGTGYSSISYLMTLEFGLLKIDKSFIESIDTDEKKQRIVTSILNLAKSCDLDVLVEGVETVEEFKKCVCLGVKKFQGYYFSHPLNFSEFVELLQNQNSSTLHETTRRTGNIKKG